LNPPAPLLSVRSLACSLDGRRVLEEISFDLGSGEFVGVIGPNGAGKSTLLHCLNATRPSTGTVLVNGVPLSGLGPRKAALALALMHQNTLVTFPFPAHDVVMMGRFPHRGRFQGEKAQDLRIVDDWLEFTDAAQLACVPITQMSGGERQRVLFAKTLAQETKILLLDEPSANLDLLYQEQVFASLKDLALQGKGILAAIHDLRMATRFCSRLILLAAGRILAVGTPEEVLTAEHLWTAFRVRVKVYRNPVTGFLDYHFLSSSDS